MEEPDKGWSWVIAFSCCFASLVLAGIFRTSGVLFVAFISSFNVTREEASWPMVVCIAVLNLTGPFSGILSQKLGCRPVILLGSLIATIGISSCYLTTSLKVITLLFGGVFGVGYGLMNTLMPVVLNSYFLNLRATANGIANSGSCIGSLLLPVVFEYLIITYGLSGCFLLTGGIVMHITVAAALMRPPPWSIKTRKLRTRNSDSEQRLCCFKRQRKYNVTAQNDSEKLCIEAIDKNNQICPLIISDDDFSQKNNLRRTKNELPMQEVSFQRENGAELKFNSLKDCPTSEAKNVNAKYCVSSGVISSFLTVLSCPMFYVTAVTNVSFYFIYHMYVVIIFDYAQDVKVVEADSKYILFAFSIADLFGRLCFGWITDRKFVTRPKFVMGCMMMIGFVFFSFPFANNYHLLILVSCFYGLLLGCTMVVFPILLLDFCGAELHAVAYGCMCFMNGFSSFGRPFLIGYFRDNVGSYSSIFFIMGIISVTASTLWLLENCFSKRSSQNTTDENF